MQCTTSVCNNNYYKLVKFNQTIIISVKKYLWTNIDNFQNKRRQPLNNYYPRIFKVEDTFLLNSDNNTSTFSNKLSDLQFAVKHVGVVGL